jgi:hypothetical protein
MQTVGYVYTFAGHGPFAPEGAVPMTTAQVEEHNAALEADELAQWQACPAVFAAYVTDKGVHTWRGVKLGKIKHQSSYRNNLGARITCITIIGTNGAIYSGRYGSDWSQLVRLRKRRDARRSTY